MEVTTQRVGKFEFSVAVCEPESEVEDLQSRRQQALTAWLLSQWDREREEGQDERHLLN